MKPRHATFGVFLIAVGVLLAAGIASAETTEKSKSASNVKAAAPAGVKPVIEAKAVEVLKAMSARLADAKTMKFTAVTMYESPSRYGAPLAYTTKSDVLLKRNDKLAVLTKGDGPAHEFYYDGQTMTAYSPSDNVAARAAAPATIDEMLKSLYQVAGTYFPFTDAIVANPYADIEKGLKLAFYIGQSNVVGGQTTDMVAYETDGVFVELWVGAEDKLPRMARAVYYDDPLRLRHQVEMSDWKMDSRIGDGDFVSKKAASATPAVFEHPSARKAPVTAQVPSAVEKGTAPASKPKSASK